MSEHREAQIVEMSIEGRDQEKSHVLLDVARPTPQERATHGYLVAITELTGATPKTAQMVRAWVDFAIERYYASVPQNVADHFEEILQRLNTQSGLYLRQHPQERVAMVLCVVHDTDTHIAIHGVPTTLLLYRTGTGWRAHDLTAQTDQGTNLFSQVLSGVLRPDDRLLLASPHTAEFFTSDRLCKISESKTINDVSEHMSRVLRELSADVSFAYAWIRVARVIDDAAPHASAHEKKSHGSMADLLLKTKSTASILAPPVITIPKDKVVTTLLKGARRGATIGWQWTRVSAQRSLAAARQSDTLQRVSRSLHPASMWRQFLQLTRSGVHYVQHLPPQRRKIFYIASSTVLIVLAAAAGLLWQQWSIARAARADQGVTAFQDTMRAANETFTSQREAEARLLLTDAQRQFDTLVADDILPDEQTAALRNELKSLTQKIRRELAVSPVAHKTTARPISVTTLGTTVALLTNAGDISVLRNGTLTPLATVAGAQKLFADKEHQRVVALIKDESMRGINLRTGRIDTVTLARAPEHTATGARVFYGGRYYAHDKLTKQIYRYDGKQPLTYDGAKKWITDGGQPTDVTHIAADSSLWLVTGNGAPLKYTSGKLQPFRVSGAEPAFERAASAATGAQSTNIYLLDAQHPRIVITDRAGVLQQQIVFPQNISGITQFALDEKETIIAIITDDGIFLTAALK